MWNKFRRFTLYAVALAVVLLPIVYWTITRSEPYGRAQTFLSNHPNVEQQIGRVKDIRLALTGNQSITFGGTSAAASLELVVAGERGAGLASVELRKELGVWDIKAARFRREGVSNAIETLPI